MEIIKHCPMTIKAGIFLAQLSQENRDKLYNKMIELYEDKEFYMTCAELVDIKNKLEKYLDLIYISYVYNKFWTKELEKEIDILWCEQNINY